MGDDSGGSHVPLTPSRRIQPQTNGDLVIYGIKPDDSKSYTCQDMESNESIHTVFLVVRMVPPAVANLSVIAHSVFALVTWGAAVDDGGYPLNRYVLGYRRDKSRLNDDDQALESAKKENSTYAWTYLSDIGPAATSKAVYGLVPNSTYYFRLCAVNRLGNGKNVSVMAETKYEAAEVDAAKEELAQGNEPTYLK
jgi:hypothetical protein